VIYDDPRTAADVCSGLVDVVADERDLLDVPRRCEMGAAQLPRRGRQRRSHASNHFQRR